jgi:hypothetical protein
LVACIDDPIGSFHPPKVLMTVRDWLWFTRIAAHPHIQASPFSDDPLQSGARPTSAVARPVPAGWKSEGRPFRSEPSEGGHELGLPRVFEALQFGMHVPIKKKAAHLFEA